MNNILTEQLHQSAVRFIQSKIYPTEVSSEVFSSFFLPL